MQPFFYDWVRTGGESEKGRMIEKLIWRKEGKMGEKKRHTLHAKKRIALKQTNYKRGDKQ